MSPAAFPRAPGGARRPVMKHAGKRVSERRHQASSGFGLSLAVEECGAVLVVAGACAGIGGVGQSTSAFCARWRST